MFICQPTTENALEISRIYAASWKSAYRGMVPQGYLCLLYTSPLINTVCRHIAAHHRERVNIGVAANHSAGIQNGIAAYFHMVAQHGTKFFQAGFQMAAVYVDLHQGFVGFYIGGDGAGAHVGFVAQNRICLLYTSSWNRHRGRY